MRCNICGSVGFRDFNGRVDAKCRKCGSLERHRVCYEVYRREGLFDESNAHQRRILQFAPEKVLYDVLVKVKANHYMTSDVSPGEYEYAQALKLRLPDDLGIFPDGYFDYLIHNHVWEHIPGHWQDHLDPFKRVLKAGGKMIFCVPFGPWSPERTIEGGELLETDDERTRLFGQHDHVRKFGLDMVGRMSEVPGTSFADDGIPDEEKRLFGGLVNQKHPETVYIWTKLPATT